MFFLGKCVKKHSYKAEFRKDVRRLALKSSEEFLRTALTNNTFDVDALDKALRMTLDNSFSYLYRLQRNTIPYEEFFYTTQNVKDLSMLGILMKKALKQNLIMVY